MGRLRVTSLFRASGRTYRALFVWALLLVASGFPPGASAQHSVARQWNEVLLEAIRNDLARPTVHARNLFHTSIALYDAWAIYDEVADPYLLGKTVGGYTCALEPLPAPLDLQAAREEALSYAAYRLLRHRFARSPGAAQSLARFDALLSRLGYASSFTSTDYRTGSAAALGNYLAQCIIGYGLQDGANEQNDYAYGHYRPANPPLAPTLSGNPDIVDPNRWQPLAFDVFIDQSGNETTGETPKFVGPEWGGVTPFALTEADRTVYERDEYGYRVYHDPGGPPYLDVDAGASSQAYQWGFALVALWSGQLDPADGVLWDISPGALGNVQAYPSTVEAYRDFYDRLGGGDTGTGRDLNPHTGAPYEPQVVPRGDYTRVLAEFWADGPDSETPPGHWFTILNYVHDHPLFERRFRGAGPVVEELEWDVKAYLALGGAVHDAAVAAWGIKGWYDYIRPVSAIRLMASRGQSTDPDLPGYAPDGLPLIPGFIEVIQEGDSLAGANGEHVAKIKLYAWRGPNAIADPRTDVAGVGWIRGEDWWPYQRPTFVSPPFAGYVSGHSTFSRAAAEVLTLLTGDPYFPGGLGAFHARKNEFLVFEEGPSVDVVLQWATYRDAADQTSLSRIWGGIHPPADDIPGRRIGERIGIDAFLRAERYFTGQTKDPVSPAETGSMVSAFPNPVRGGEVLTIQWSRPADEAVAALYNLQGQLVYTQRVEDQHYILLSTDGLASGLYLLRVTSPTWESSRTVVVLR